MSRGPRESWRFGTTTRLLCAIVVVMVSPCYCQLPRAAPIRIDCGNLNPAQGAPFKDQGLDWSTDYGFSGGIPYTVNSPDTALSLEYQTLRAFGNISDVNKYPDDYFVGCYNIGLGPDSAGRYLIRAGFAHFNYDNSDQSDPSERSDVSVKMAVTINDVPAEALEFPMYSVFWSSWIVDVSGLVVNFCLRKLDTDTVPFINQLEIFPVDGHAYSVPRVKYPNGAVLSMHLRLNMGGPDLSEMQDPGYRLWDSDASIFNASNWPANEMPASVSTNNISTSYLSTQDVPLLYYGLPKELFQSARVATVGSEGVLFFTISEVLSNNDNDFLIILYFSEIKETNTPKIGDRTFDIYINNQRVVQNFDIRSEAGDRPNTAVMVNFTTKLLPPDNSLTIRLNTSAAAIYYPMLSGMEAYEIIPDIPEPNFDQTNVPIPIRIDCGGPLSSQDPKGNWWVYDRGYSSGEPATLNSSEIPSPAPTVQETVRFFPEGESNCYVVEMHSPGPFIVRPYFVYGDYDGRSISPRFSLAVQGEFVYTNFTVPYFGYPYGRHDVITSPADDDTITVCFITEDENTVPFVNGLEFLPQLPSAYAQFMQGVPDAARTMLVLVARLTCGGHDFGDGIDLTVAPNGQTLQAQDKGYRVWYRDATFQSPPLVISRPGAIRDVAPVPAFNINNIHSNAPEQFPSLLYASARSSTTRNGHIIYNINLGRIRPPNEQILCLLHFAELETPAAQPGKRVFDIRINNQPVISGFDVFARAGARYTPYVVQRVLVAANNYVTIDLSPTPTSLYPPIINGIEIFRLVPLPPGTVAADVLALRTLGASLGLGRDFGWQGDPCYPVRWYGIDCQDDAGGLPVRITSISLVDEAPPPNGTIVPGALGALNALTEVTLSGLGLQGSIPPDIGMLANLQRLDLSNNDLSGPIPVATIAMMMERNANLVVNLTGNPRLCGGFGYGSCGSGGGGGLSAGAIAGVVLAVVFVAAVAAAALVVYRKRRAAYAFHRMDSGLSDSDILKGPDTMGAGAERRRAHHARSMKLPPRSNSLGRSDSFSSTGSSNRFSSQRTRDIMDVELNSHHDSLVGGIGGGGGSRGGSRLRPHEDVNYVGYE